MIIQCENNYQLENSEAGYWKIRINKGKELITEEIIEALKDFNQPIYWNDSECKHWFFDYKICDTLWVEGANVDCNKMIIDINLY